MSSRLKVVVVAVAVAVVVLIHLCGSYEARQFVNLCARQRGVAGLTFRSFYALADNSRYQLST